MTPPVEREAEHATLHVSPSVPKRQADRVANAKGGVGGTPRPGVGHGRGRGRRARRWERGRHVGATSGGQSTANHSAPPSKLRDRAAEQRMRAMGACEGVGGGGRNAVRRAARFGRHWGHTPPLPHGVPVGGEANTACRPGSGGAWKRPGGAGAVGLLGRAANWEPRWHGLFYAAPGPSPRAHPHAAAGPRLKREKRVAHCMRPRQTLHAIGGATGVRGARPARHHRAGCWEKLIWRSISLSVRAGRREAAEDLPLGGLLWREKRRVGNQVRSCWRGFWAHRLQEGRVRHA